jgi:hypothetical protein
MIEYIKNIIPRLRGFSEKVNKEELLIGKTWVWVGFNQGYSTLHFLGDKRLLISQLGDVQEGSWEFIGNDHLLHLKGSGFSVLLNHGILFKGVLIMQKQGVLDSYEVLYDEQVIPNGDVIKYIESQITKPFTIDQASEVKNDYPYSIFISGTELLFDKYPEVGMIIHSSEVFSGKVYRLPKNRAVEILNNRIIKVFYPVELVTKTGVLVLEIEIFLDNKPKGIGFFKNKDELPDGEFIIESINPSHFNWKRIFFKKGSITRVSYSGQVEDIVMTLFFTFVGIFILLFILHQLGF